MIPTYPNFTSSRFASSLPSFIFVTAETSHPPGAPWGSCNLVASSAWYHLAVSETCAQLSRFCPKAVYQVAGNVVHEIRDYILRPRALIQNLPDVQGENPSSLQPLNPSPSHTYIRQPHHPNDLGHHLGHQGCVLWAPLESTLVFGQNARLRHDTSPLRHQANPPGVVRPMTKRSS